MVVIGANLTVHIVVPLRLRLALHPDVGQPHEVVRSLT
jgi:hypothetical protein